MILTKKLQILFLILTLTLGAKIVRDGTLNNDKCDYKVTISGLADKQGAILISRYKEEGASDWTYESGFGGFSKDGDTLYGCSTEETGSDSGIKDLTCMEMDSNDMVELSNDEIVITYDGADQVETQLSELEDQLDKKCDDWQSIYYLCDEIKTNGDSFNCDSSVKLIKPKGDKECFSS